jgi:hypothetical protein
MTPAQFIQQLEAENGVQLFIERGRLKMAGDPKTLQVLYPVVAARVNELKQALTQVRTIANRTIRRAKRSSASGFQNATRCNPMPPKTNRMELRRRSCPEQ